MNTQETLSTLASRPSAKPDERPAIVNDEAASLRIVRQSLQADPPSIRFVARDLRLPQL
jgi:hypothetical protein